MRLADNTQTSSHTPATQASSISVPRPTSILPGYEAAGYEAAAESLTLKSADILQQSLLISAYLKYIVKTNEYSILVTEC